MAGNDTNGMETIEIPKEVLAKLESFQQKGESISQVIERLVEQVQDGKSSIIHWRPECKLLLLGPTMAGKTSIRKVFFENGDPQDVLDGQPTQHSTERFVYDWLDVMIEVVEVPGHEIDPSTFPESELFAKVDDIVYVLDISSWEQDKGAVAKDMTEIAAALESLQSSACVTLLLHKRDLIDEKDRRATANAIRQHVQPIFQGGSSLLEIGATSIHPEHVLDTLRFLRRILGRHSVFLRKALIPLAQK
jgi:hypothetical protein